jgi:hypothetical protein
MMLRGHLLLCREVMAEALREARPRARLPHMRRTFVDRQYLPSTGMDRSKWEIILEELTRMGYIVKQDRVDETDS